VGFEVDVTQRPAVDAAVASVRDEFGPIQIVVTSAGVTAFEPFTDITLEQWNRTMAINLTGTFNCVQSAIPDMVAAGWGRIVTISSTAGQTGAPNQADYVASKGGVIALTKALAFEFASNGITANTIPPRAGRYAHGPQCRRTRQAAERHRPRGHDAAQTRRNRGRHRRRV
jgi:2-hydroxycyclohexanecarboxyl-CoA dehydrogenase